jgi:iron(III) transport system substrate-binding protein
MRTRNPDRPPSSPFRAVSSRRRASAAVLCALASPTLLAAGCAKERQEVVVYLALDLEHAQSILDDFERETGIHVRAIADDEITKTVALARRILLDQEHQKADVFWNNEIVNTIRVKNAGCLEPYLSPSAADIPERFKAKDGTWTGFAARARVLIVNTKTCPEQRTPRSMLDFAEPARKGEAAIARPIAGTTATHLAVLFHKLGDETARKWWTDLLANQTGILTGNGHVMREVRSGTFQWGFTDTDDFFVALSDGYPVKCVYPDQGDGQIGCLVIPNTIALLKNAPRPDFGRRFIDYVLSRRVEERLAHGSSAQIPVREDVPAPPHVRRLKDLKLMDADFEAAASAFDAAQEWLTRPR